MFAAALSATELAAGGVHVMGSRGMSGAAMGDCDRLHV